MNLKEEKNEKKNLGLNVVGKKGLIELNESQDDDEIDVLELSLVLIDKVFYIAFFGLLGAIILNAYAFFMIAPTYESTAKLYVVSASDDSVVDLSDLDIGTSLTSDYEELMCSYPVLDQVIEKLELDMTYTDLAKLITIENPEDTRVLKITALTDDPELSRDIANTMVEVSVDYLPKTMGTEEPNIAQEARTAIEKSGPSYIKFTLFGAVIGAALCCIYIIFRFLTNDTIRTAEDMEKYFGIVPLTVIPDIEAIEGNTDRKRSRREK